MADINYTTLKYDNNLTRVPGNLDVITGGENPNNTSEQTQDLAQAGGNTAASSSVRGGSAQQASVASEGAMADVVIINSIQSANWKPKTVGFYIDGQTGYAEFSNVYVSGNINATTGTIGGWTINTTTISSSGLVLDSAGSIGTSAFVSGQTGWRIDATGTAEFNNIIARGEFRTAVLTKGEVHATGGSLLVLSASVLLNNFTSVTTPTTSLLDLKDPPSGHTQLFSVNDIVRIKDGSGLDNWLKVTVVSDQTTFYRYTVVKQSGTNGTFYPGTGVVNYKQAADGFVLLTSDMTNSPYIDIGLSGATPWTSTTPKVRVGNLAGITDVTFGALTGFGIWTDSGYFTGSINASSGLIGGWTLGANSLTSGSGSTTVGFSNAVTAGDDIRIYAGSATPSTAPFRVSEAGNAVVNSLQRNDYHWFTAFESIDGYQTTLIGAGTAAVGGGGNLVITSGALTSNSTQLDKIALYNGGQLTWNKDRKIKIGIKFEQTGSQTIRIGAGTLTSIGRQIAFLLSNSTLYGVSGDGTNTTLVSYGTINTALTYVLEARFITGTSVEFFVNTTSIGTSTTNLPSGGTSADFIFSVLVQTDENLAKVVNIGFNDFWQAN